MATAVVLSAFLGAVPAGAQQTDTVVTAPEAFIASASARGLYLKIGDLTVTLGSSGALVLSTPKAQAQGAGALIGTGSTANALADGPDKSQVTPPACEPVSIAGLLGLALACGQASASTTGGLPQASSKGEVAEVVVGGTLLTPLLQQIGALLGQTVGAVVDPLTNVLGGLLNPLLGALNLNVNSLVDELLTGLQRATALLSISLGPSTSAATTTAAKVNAVGQAEGAIIKVLPNLTLLGAPLATITVGAGRASVDVTRPAASQSGAVTATATPTFDAALVRVAVLDAVSIPIGLGDPLPGLLNGLLSLSIGGGRVADGPNGTKTAVADGVGLSLLNGTVVLQLAHAEATGGGVSAQISLQQRIVPVVQPQPQPELPRTGGIAWFPMLGAVMLLGAYGTRRLVSVRR